MSRYRFSHPQVLLAMLLAMQMGLGERVMCLAPEDHPPVTGLQQTDCHRAVHASTHHAHHEQPCAEDVCNAHHEGCVDVSVVCDGASTGPSLSHIHLGSPTVYFLKGTDAIAPGLDPARFMALKPPGALRALSSVVLTI
jgi:hypothetical protein